MWIGAIGFAVSDIHTQSKLSRGLPIISDYSTKHIWDLQEYLLTLYHNQIIVLVSVIMWVVGTSKVPVGSPRKILCGYEHTASAMVSLPITANRTKEQCPIQSYVAGFVTYRQRLVRKQAAAVCRPYTCAFRQLELCFGQPWGLRCIRPTND